MKGSSNMPMGGTTPGKAQHCSGSLPGLLPAGIVCAETREPGDELLLLPEELAYVAGAVEKRRREFAAGRLCAARALAALDVARSPLLVADDRSPRWPSGIVGSITHTAGFCGAAVAARDAFAGIGIDAEAVSDTPWKISHRICAPDELQWLRAVPEPDRNAMATLVFSAKECFYKSQYASTGEQLEFLDVSVVIGDGWFEVLPRREIRIFAGRSTPIVGRFVLEQDLVLTGLALPAPDTAHQSVKVRSPGGGTTK